MRVRCPKCFKFYTVEEQAYHDKIECFILEEEMNKPPEPRVPSEAEQRKQYKMRFGKYPEDDDL